MVTAVTSFGRSGLYDWLIQRVSAVILAAYTFFVVGFILLHPDMNYSEWQDLFSHFWMRFFSLITLVAMAVHAWIGLWSVLTDYVTVRMVGAAGNVIRIAIQMILAIVTIAYTLWGVEILWGL